MSIQFDPFATIAYQAAIAEAQRRAHYETSLARLWDGNMETNIELRADIESSGEDTVYDPGQVQITVPMRSPEGRFLMYYLPEEEDAHFTIEQPRPGEFANYDNRIAYKLTVIQPTLAEDGTEIVKATGPCITAHWNATILMANPWLPVSAQYPHIYALPGNTRDLYLHSMHVNLWHQYSPLWRIPDNPMSPAAWIEGINPNDWPIMVNPLYKGASRGTITHWRFDLALDAMRQGLEDAHCIPTAKFWLPGDPQPFPSHATLTRPTIILDIEIHDGVRGVTGTAADGFIQLGLELLDDLVVEFIHPLLTSGLPTSTSNTPATDLLGLGPAQPWPIYRYGEYSGLLSAEVTIHKSLWHTTYTGGRSPDWVNQGITLAITTGLSYLGFLLAVPGLDNLYQGQFDDTLLAFAKQTDRRRRRLAGRFAFDSGWEGGPGVGFGISTYLALRSGWWKSRPYRSNKVEVADMAPYPVGEIIRKGIRCVFEMPDGSLYVDQVTSVAWHRTRDQQMVWTLSIGDDKDDEDPVAALWRHVGELRTTAKRLFLGA